MERILSPNSIVSPSYKRTTGKKAWRENLRYAIFAADIIRSTLGPKGAYKMVTYNKGPEKVVKVTKDAIAILDELAIQYPPSVIIAEAAKMQRDEAGDGVATFVVFTSALLKKADEMLSMGIHANTIIHGYSLASDRALEIIDDKATDQHEYDPLTVVDCGRKLLTPSIRSLIREAYPNLRCDGRYVKENVGFLKKTGGCIPEIKLIDTPKSGANVMFNAEAGSQTNPLSPGDQATIVFTPNFAGSAFYYICPIPSHAEMGMGGSVIVTG
jgi:archaeal chaperonin